MVNNRYVIFEEQAWAIETFVAFAAAAAAHAVDQVSEDISEEHGFVYTETSARRLARSRLLGPRVTGGEIAVPLYTRGTTTLLYYALGQVTTTEPITLLTPPNFKHVIVPSTTIPSFRMGIGKDLNQHQFVGCAIKSLKLDYTIGDPAMATFDLLVRKELTPPGTLLTPTFPDYDVKERSFLGTEVVAKVDGATVGYVRNFSVDIGNDLVEDNHSFGSRFLPDLRVQGLEITGSVTIAFDDIVRYTDVLDEVEVKLEFLFATGTIGTANYRQMEVILGKISYDSAKLPTDGSNEFILEVNFQAETDPGVDENGIQLVVYNDETAAEFAI